MPAEINLLLNRLAELLGADNVSVEGENMVVRPASAGETAAVVELAWKEKIIVVPAGYVIGPSVPPGPGRKIILSLERMNKIRHFDRQSLSMVVDPAVAADEIIKTAAEHGVYFPGKHCRHQKPTIGENVTSCFIEGDPDFKCRYVCISGLEMALLEGGTATVDGSFVREGDSYSLPFLLAGHREKTAVITGMHIKLMPSPPSENGVYLLAAAFGRPDDAFDLAPFLASCRGIKKVAVFDATFISPLTEYLKNLFSGMEKHGAYVLFTLEEDPGQLDPAARELAEICHRRGALEILMAAATYQREMINTALNSILAVLSAENNLHQQNGPGPEKEVGRRLKALVWQSDPEERKAFYGA